MGWKRFGDYEGYLLQFPILTYMKDDIVSSFQCGKIVISGKIQINLRQMDGWTIQRGI